MWQLALHMEEGLTDQTARELEEARQAANDALDRAQKDPSQVNRDELQKPPRRAGERHPAPHAGAARPVAAQPG